MASFNHGNISKFTLGGTSMDQWTTSTSLDMTREIKDIRPIGGAAVSRVVGPYMSTLSVEFGYDPALDAILSPIFLASTPTSSTFSFQPAGSGGGTHTFSGSALMATYRTDASGSDVAKISATFAVVGTVTST
jgi:hypothetical protein